MHPLDSFLKYTMHFVFIVLQENKDTDHWQLQVTESVSMYSNNTVTGFIIEFIILAVFRCSQCTGCSSCLIVSGDISNCHSFLSRIRRSVRHSKIFIGGKKTSVQLIARSRDTITGVAIATATIIG